MEKTLNEAKITRLGKSMEQLSNLVSKDLGWPVKFFIEEEMDRMSRQRIIITSSPLPENYFGIFAFMVKGATVGSHGNTLNSDGTVSFTPHFFYSHRNGGSNGHELCDAFGNPYYYEYKNEEWKRMRFFVE